MAHVDDGTLNALLDGELEAAEALAIRAHVAGCAECGARFEEAKRFLAAADELLGQVSVPAAAAPPAAPAQLPVPVPEAAPRRVSKTAREVAVDIDGATQQSPAIAPNVPREGEVAPRPRSPSTGAALRPLLDDRRPRRARRPDWATLAWAASVVLALGVGYLASEVRRTGVPADGARIARALPDSAAPDLAVGATPGAEQSVAAPAAPRSSASGGAAADAFAAAAPVTKSRGYAPPKAAAPLSGDAGPVALAAPAPAASARPAAAPVLPSLNQPEPAQLAQRPAAPARDAAANAVGRVDAGVRAQQRAAESAGIAAAAEPPSTVLMRAAPSGAGAAAVARPLFRLSDMDGAAASLAGTLRTLQGLSVENVKIGPGAAVPGAQADREVVRIVYSDPQGHRLQLDQQRLPTPRAANREARARALPAVLGLAYGDTLSTTEPGGATRIRWLDPAGLWLSLSGTLSPDSLRALLALVR